MNSKDFALSRVLGSASFQQKLLDALEKEIFLCQKCPLCKTRNRPLAGDGFCSAKIVMVGESPGYYEDMQGKAFVGNAGKILDQMLLENGLSRKDLYITNILKCHPPKNHDPLPHEIEACSAYLYRQLKIIKPKIIVTLGKFAAKELFFKTHLPFSRIGESHGKMFEIKASYGPVKIIALYHPSAACHNPGMLETLKKDFKKAAVFLQTAYQP